jgi:hypothetical protein
VNFLFKPKELIFNPASVRYFFCIIVVSFFALSATYAQERNETRGDSINRVTPSAVADSLASIGSDIKSDTIKNIPKGDIETTIDYSAKDSIRASVDGKMIWLYGNAKIVYGDIKLEAEEITIDYGQNTLTANGRRDSLGQRVGYPVFTNGAEVYETKDIIYNFKTRRARISEVVTAQGEGFLHSGAAFKNENDEILSINNSYTTCNLEHPHFRIRSTKTKAIPNDKIVSGPFFLEFNDIPLPAAFLFGMFPAKQESTSGIIFPSFGEEKRRGFNMRGGGYFFDISEYVKLAVTGDLYSKGGHALYANSSYVKRYAYNGTVNFAYSKNPDGDDRIETDSDTRDFRLTWSHSPQSKGTGRFAASINAATATFNKNNNLMYGTSSDLYSSSLNNITAKLSSNVSYSKRFSGTPFSMGLNLSHNQDLQTREVDLQLPTLSVNMTNIYPFQSKTGKTGPLDNLSLSYSMNASNRITNNLGRITEKANADSIAPFTFDNFGRYIENGKKGIRHTLPVSFSFKALRFFTISPSFSYEEKWYGERINWAYDEVTKEYYKDEIVKEFTRVANYNTSVGLTTRLYGMYNVKNPNRSIKAIRHVVNPSVSFNYTPDFTRNENYFKRFDFNKGTPEAYTEYKSLHEGAVYGGSGTGKSSAIGFGIGNNVEMKVKNEKDSVARKVMLLNNFSINSSYNLIADSFKLANISMAANTNLLDNLINMNLSATLDPYEIIDVFDEDGNVTRERRRDNVIFGRGGFGRITSAALNLSTNLNPKGRSKQTSSREKIAKSDLPEQEKEFLLKNPDVYVDFDIPWNLNLGFNMRYTHAVSSEPKFVQSLQASGDVSLSEKWKVTYSSGYDFENKAFTQTNLGISRDLHCWTMNVNWVPFGRFQSFYFVIAVKASILQDLKLERRKPWFDNL